MKKVLEKIWEVLKATPNVVLKTRTGRYLLALLIVALIKGYYEQITVNDVLIILNGILGTLYGNETTEDLKKFYE
jgi:hypothetical protein